MNSIVAKKIRGVRSTQDAEVRISVRKTDPNTSPPIREFLEKQSLQSLTHDPRWPGVFSNAFGHVPYVVEAVRGETVVGVLPLMFISSFLFKRFLTSHPYLNSGGVVAEDESIASRLVDHAVELADELDVRLLELRHEDAVPNYRLWQPETQKVHMRLSLPDTPAHLWDQLKSKVRNQVKKGQQQGFSVHWGQQDLLKDFHRVFSRNMRDLGTPVFGRNFFGEILRAFPTEAELCILRLGSKPITAALLLHGAGVTEVPSASSLREYNSTNGNMLMYWHLLSRAIEKSQCVFDFGRSSAGCGTYRFKKQWGAKPIPAIWQYYVREGEINQMRPNSGKFDQLIRVWQRLPVALTCLVGPYIVRGIP